MKGTTSIPDRRADSEREIQLKRTLSKTKAALNTLVKKGESFKNAHRLAQFIAQIVGVDSSLYRKPSTPQKELFDSYAVKLCRQLPKSMQMNHLLPAETLTIKLSEATHRITVLEKILGDLSDRSNKVEKITKANTFLPEFEITCKLVEVILAEDQCLYFEKGILMTRASMTGLPAPLSDVKTCKPFLDWRHARNTHVGSLSTAELEESLRPSAQTGTNEVD
ncbi:hypothetical protein [Pseudomonas amygdali]|uniref:hypothetical protein n=1 Tax=Pseudomonas amygdali TaxID=47877 RepID=UPI0009BEB793|nr:hypothetical protein [Pseudomonas amygdali]PPS23393.1 hypothetical protein BVY10_28090 [Pseudomonas amygdali pv. morsprunorum]